MIKAIVSDFSRVLLFPKDKTYQGSLNALHKKFSINNDYNILDYFELNTELLDYYKTLTPSINLYILTSDTIQDDPVLQQYLNPIFKTIYSASKMNVDKKNPEAYKKICIDLNLLPEEVLYVDDSEENSKAAESAGLQIIQYNNNLDLFENISKNLTE
jgi:HAD superfamily hydrolase (TIGR01549 family)